MRIDVFCSWGDGPDVGINLKRSEEEAKRYRNSQNLFFVDLTAKEARNMAAKLVAAAESAERMDRQATEYFALEEWAESG